jgi:cytochrome P450
MIVAADSAFGRRADSPTGLGQSLAALGREHPVIADELVGAPLVLRHRDVRAAIADTSTFGTACDSAGPLRTAMIAQEGLEHLRQRRIHDRFFGARARAKYARVVERVAAETFGAFAGRHRAELVEEAVAAYPMRVFLALLGVCDDEEDKVGERVRGWMRTVLSRLGPPLNPRTAQPGERALADLNAFVAGLVDNRRPGDHLLGEIIRAHTDEGDYCADAVVAVAVGLLLGGCEKTVHMLTGTLAALLLNPRELRRVRADPLLADSAIDEACRWASPSVGLYRRVRRDVKVAGTTLAEGSVTYLCIAAAHFDRDVYSRPEVFDPGRLRLGRLGHLGFGAGPHYCSGAPLAWIEVRAAVSALLKACPELRLDPDNPPAFYYGARDFAQHGTDALVVLLD